MRSREMKHFSFSMFYNKSKLCEKNKNYIVAIVKVHIWNWNEFVLWDKKTIINKWKNQNWNFYIFSRIWKIGEK